jgi:hypothetical protein
MGAKTPMPPKRYSNLERILTSIISMSKLSRIFFEKNA